MLELNKVYILTESEMRTIRDAINLSRNNANTVVQFAGEHPDKNKLLKWCVSACGAQFEKATEAAKIVFPEIFFD